jgi:protein gp37
MGVNTKIDWTDSTWNPLHGCSRVSEGCRNCYAERMAHRFQHLDSYCYTTHTVDGHPAWTGKVNFDKKHLLDPLKWRPVKQGAGNRDQGSVRPRRVFVNSMSDLFHENVERNWAVQIFAIMAVAHWHDFLVLTKRPQKMFDLIFSDGFREEVMIEAQRIIKLHSASLPSLPDGAEWVDDAIEFEMPWPLPNVWIGVSVENQAAADERIPLLLQTPAAVRFVSCEPLLGPMDLAQIDTSAFDCGSGTKNALTGDLRLPGFGSVSSTTIHGKRLNWVICGGESGPGARPMHLDWVRGMRDQCQEAGVPFFFKSWGEWAPIDFDLSIGGSISGDGAMGRVGKKAAGCLLDGREWKQFPTISKGKRNDDSD